MRHTVVMLLTDEQIQKASLMEKVVGVDTNEAIDAIVQLQIFSADRQSYANDVLNKVYDMDDKKEAAHRVKAALRRIKTDNEQAPARKSEADELRATKTAGATETTTSKSPRPREVWEPYPEKDVVDAVVEKQDVELLYHLFDPDHEPEDDVTKAIRRNVQPIITWLGGTAEHTLEALAILDRIFVDTKDAKIMVPYVRKLLDKNSKVLQQHMEKHVEQTIEWLVQLKSTRASAIEKWFKSHCPMTKADVILQTLQRREDRWNRAALQNWQKALVSQILDARQYPELVERLLETSPALILSVVPKSPPDDFVPLLIEYMKKEKTNDDHVLRVVQMLEQAASGPAGEHILLEFGQIWKAAFKIEAKATAALDSLIRMSKSLGEKHAKRIANMDIPKVMRWFPSKQAAADIAYQQEFWAMKMIDAGLASSSDKKDLAAVFTMKVGDIINRYRDAPSVSFRRKIALVLFELTNKRSKVLSSHITALLRHLQPKDDVMSEIIRGIDVRYLLGSVESIADILKSPFPTQHKEVARLLDRMVVEDWERVANAMLQILMEPEQEPTPGHEIAAAIVAHIIVEHPAFVAKIHDKQKILQSLESFKNTTRDKKKRTDFTAAIERMQANASGTSGSER